MLNPCTKQNKFPDRKYPLVRRCIHTQSHTHTLKKHVNTHCNTHALAIPDNSLDQVSHRFNIARPGVGHRRLINVFSTGFEGHVVTRVTLGAVTHWTVRVEARASEREARAHGSLVRTQTVLTRV